MFGIDCGLESVANCSDELAKSIDGRFDLLLNLETD